jgi:hypothetical protein
MVDYTQVTPAEMRGLAARYLGRSAAGGWRCCHRRRPRAAAVADAQLVGNETITEVTFARRSRGG